jgi:hypothetical protein
MSAPDQLDFTSSAYGIDLLFGVTISGIQALALMQQEFPSTAAGFLRAITELLEITELNTIRYRYMIGQPCESDQDAERFFWPLVPQETREKLSSFKNVTTWQALQAEFVIQNLACQSRLALTPLSQRTGETTRVVRHITFQTDFQLLTPIAVADFDATAFIKNLRDEKIKEILSKLAPHIS